MELRQRHYDNPNIGIMDDIITRFFMPLLDGYWARYNYKFKTLHGDEFNAKAEAIVHLWSKFDNFKPELGFNSLSYFTQLASRFFFGENKDAETYAGRFLNESSFRSLEDLD